MSHLQGSIILRNLVKMYKVDEPQKNMVEVKYWYCCLSCYPKVQAYTKYHYCTQQAYDVYTTTPQRRRNVMTLRLRWADVVLTSCACWVTFVVFWEMNLNIRVKARVDTNLQKCEP